MSHKVSVIIPVRNMARFLPDAVASIPDVDEILIAVAASDDDTLQVARELARRRAGVVVLDNPKTTPAAGRNAGLCHARGDVIAFNDADDVWPRDKLEQAARLASIVSRGLTWWGAASPISTNSIQTLSLRHRTRAWKAASRSRCRR